MSIYPVSTPRLTQRSPHSFTCWDLDAFVTWLESQQFIRIPTSRALVEHSRWERSQRLVVVYHNGSVTVQGKQPAPCIALLTTLVAEAAEAAVR